MRVRGFFDGLSPEIRSMPDSSAFGLDEYDDWCKNDDYLHDSEHDSEHVGRNEYLLLYNDWVLPVGPARRAVATSWASNRRSG
jgi:hypothetical protein